MIQIILMETEHAENLGSVARVMKNFGLRQLVLINPGVSVNDPVAIKVAKHAKDVLKSAVIADKSFLDNMDCLVGTTSVIGSDYNIPRSPLTPVEMAAKISGVDTKIGLLFGREGEGLYNDELQKCDFTVTIPSSKEYPALNLAQSVAIVCYELFKHSAGKKVAEHITPMSAEEKKAALKSIDELLELLDFATEQKKETQRKLWKRMLGKAMLTKREAFAFLGFLRKLASKLKP